MARTVGTGTNYMSVAVFNTATTNVTLALWIKLLGTGGGTSRVVFANGNNSGSTGFALAFQTAGSGTIQMLIQGLAWIGSGSALTTGVWTHVVMARATGNWYLYKNGTAIENAAGTPNTPSGSMWLGGVNDATTHTPDASLAEAGFWTVLLTDPEIAALAQGVSPNNIRRSSLAGYWPLYGAGSPEADLSSGVHNMAITGTVPVVDHSPSGEYVFEDYSFAVPVVVPVTSTLSVTATNTVTLNTLKVTLKTLSTTITAVIKKLSAPSRILNATAVSVPKKVMQLSRTYTLVASHTITYTKTFFKTLSSIATHLVSVCNTRFGVSSLSTIDIDNRWSLSEDFIGFSLDAVNSYSLNIDLQC